MLNHTSASHIERILREIPAQPPFSPAADRAAWRQVRARVGDLAVKELIRQAEQSAQAAIPALPASLWLECLRTGKREGYEDPCYQRRLLLRDLALGECLEYQGRFLDALMNVIWAICEETSWVYPAHHAELPDPGQPYIDLGAAGTAFDLATVDGLLGADLPPAVSQRIRHEVNQRLLIPYLARDDFWWLYGQPERPANNWTAVCSAGVMAAAMYLEPDPARLAAVLEKGLRSLGAYLATFDEDGGTSEGPGYWSYGFGHYVLIAQLIEQRTAGQLALMDGELIRKIAAFPLRTMLSSGQYVSFSDTPRQAALIAAMLTYLGRRLAVPGLRALAQQPISNLSSGLNVDFSWRLRSLLWDLPQPAAAAVTLARHDWYNGMQWMIARHDPADPDALVLAAKGGHNDEMHNHNDLGAFIVQVKQEALLTDIGCGHYTLQYFGDERYDLFVPSSKGHPVPVPNGQLQSPGRQYAARLLGHSAGADQDVLQIDLRAAYPSAANLETLERRLVLHREPHPAGAAGWVTLEDRFAFQETPGAFESALTTFAQVELRQGAVIISGERGRLRVTYPDQAYGVRVEHYPDIDFADGLKAVNRVVFFLLESSQAGLLRLEIVPIE
jgi:hypothetical protein